VASSTKTKPKDEVARAVAGIERSVGRLIALLENDDAFLEQKALVALHGLGPAAIGFLVRALDKNRNNPRLRRRIVSALVALARDPELAWPASTALIEALRSEEDRSIVAMAVAAVVKLGPIPDASLPERLRRDAQVEVNAPVAGPA
jgi:hypothetical protein